MHEVKQPFTSNAQSCISEENNLQGDSKESFSRLSSDLHNYLLRGIVDNNFNNVDVWPDYNFEFANSYMVQSSSELIKVDNSTRLAAIFRSINRVAPDSIETPSAKTSTTANPQMFAKKTTSFSEGKVIIHKKTRMKRNEIVDIDVLLQKIDPLLAASNDPVHQAMEAVADQYEKKISASDLILLRNSLVLATKHNTIKNIYDDYIASLKLVGGTVINFMSQ